MKIHEGKLNAIVRGVACDFDGNTWWTPDDDLRGLLNDATASTPKTHTGIKQLAEIILRKLDLWETAQIISVQQATDIPDLPEGAIE
jgi:hypothetical protein